MDHGKQTDLNVSVLVDNVHPPIHALFVAELLPEYEISVCILYSFYLSDIISHLWLLLFLSLLLHTALHKLQVTCSEAWCRRRTLWSRDQTRRSSLTRSQTSPSTRKKINLTEDIEETAVLDLHGVYVAHPGLPVWVPHPGPRAQAQVRRRVADLRHHLPLPRVRLDFVNSSLKRWASLMLSTS